MGRVLLFIALAWLIYWVITRMIASYKANQHKATADSQTQTDQNQSGQSQAHLKIVQCSRCGCHVPETESHLNNEQVVCNSTQCNDL